MVRAWVLFVDEPADRVFAGALAWGEARGYALGLVNPGNVDVVQVSIFRHDAVANVWREIAHRCNPIYAGGYPEPAAGQ